MPRLIAALLALFSVGPVAADGGNPLAEHRWNDRVLLLYAPAADAPELAHYRAELAARQCGIADRDLVTGEVIGEHAGLLGDARLSPERARSLRAHHGVPRDRVATILVGKDGGVKLNLAGVAALSQVFQRIDGMPMRQREMAEGDAGCSDSR